MVRQVYRIYLYVVCVALLVFATVGLGQLLDLVLALTPLRGTFRGPPGRDQIIQQVVFAVVAWVVAALVGGLHYRLIRRDIAREPAAGSGAIRAFFLNVPQGIAALVAVFVASSTFSMLAYNVRTDYVPDAAAPFAAALAALAMAIALEWERRRYAPAPGAAVVFQRLHLYGVPLIILFSGGIVGTWSNAIRTTLAALLSRLNLYQPLDPRCATLPLPQRFQYGPCMLQDVPLLWTAVLVLVAGIGVYALLARGDRQSWLRAVAHLGSWGLGIVFIVIGLYIGLELALHALFRLPATWADVASPWGGARFDFISPLTLGVVVALVYGFWLRAEAATLPLQPVATGLSMEALAAFIGAVPFYFGAWILISNGFFWLAGPSTRPSVEEWASAIALTVAGVGYIPLALDLRRRTVATSVTVPRRALVLALLAGGIVAGVAGLSVLLYALATAALGAPLPDWQQTARVAGAGLIVGAALTGIYGWIALRGQYFESLFARFGAALIPAAPSQPVAAASDRLETIEQVLDAFATHALTRDEAAARIREITQSTPATPAGV